MIERKGRVCRTSMAVSFSALMSLRAIRRSMSSMMTGLLRPLTKTLPTTNALHSQSAQGNVRDTHSRSHRGSCSLHVS